MSKYVGEEPTTTGTLDVVSGQQLHKLVDLADDELKRYGSPPKQVEASFTDGDGHVYKGTLYLVEEEQKSCI